MSVCMDAFQERSLALNLCSCTDIPFMTHTDLSSKMLQVYVWCGTVRREREETSRVVVGKVRCTFKNNTFLLLFQDQGADMMCLPFDLSEGGEVRERE